MCKFHSHWVITHMVFCNKGAIYIAPNARISEATTNRNALHHYQNTKKKQTNSKSLTCHVPPAIQLYGSSFPNTPPLAALCSRPYGNNHGRGTNISASPYGVVTSDPARPTIMPLTVSFGFAVWKVYIYKHPVVVTRSANAHTWQNVLPWSIIWE